MDLNEQTIAEIASQLGVSNSKKVDKRALANLSSKSDAELEREITRLKERLRANNVSYEQQMAIVKSLAPMMDNKQKARLNKFIEILNK